MQTTGETRVAVGELVLQFVAADGDLVGVDDDDEVATVDIRRECRLVLAAQQIGCRDGEPAEHHVGGVDDVPRARGVTRLRRVRRHSAYLLSLGLDPGVTRVPVRRVRLGWSRRPTLTRGPVAYRTPTSSLPAGVAAGQNAFDGFRAMSAGVNAGVNDSRKE